MRLFVRVLLIVTGSVMISGCATSGVPAPRPYPGAPLPPTADAGRVPGSSAAPSALATAVVDTARDLLGTPYRSGGADPAGFDCSGFVQYVFARAGAALPRSVREQWEAGRPVDPESVAAGDLVFFAIEGTDVSHVGIALDQETFVHAPSARGVVRVERLKAGYWSKRYAGARRYLRP